jgi:hypothetical protein
MTSITLAIITINNNNKNSKENKIIVEYIYDNIVALNKRGIKFRFVKKRIRTCANMLIENNKYEGVNEILSFLSANINNKQKEQKKENTAITNPEFCMEQYMERNATVHVEEDDDKVDKKRKERAAEIAEHRKLAKPKKEEKKEPVENQKSVKTSYDDLKDNLTKSGSVSFSDNPEIVSFLKNKTKNMTTEDINDYNLLKSMGESNSGLFL